MRTGWEHRDSGKRETEPNPLGDALRATAAQRGLDAVLVTNLLNVRYLTGFTGSNGVLLVQTAGADLFATDGLKT